ncbi:MAG: mechanosensitive ion channel [Bacteriovoracaceae bacterium]|nr:mechanosensitive ion channel [Bacteriovoracaceae bacterium]
MDLHDLVMAWTPFGSSMVFGVILLFSIKKILDYKAKKRVERSQVGAQLSLLILTVSFIIVLILATPLSENTKGQLLSLIGILLTAAIALSSTTFLGNIMAGFMIRTLRKFDPGDFLRVDTYFGRVTELGLLHTEIQLEDKDLAIIPNLHLVTRPLKVIHSNGTLVTENVSLGYDVNPNDIEAALIKASEKTGLEESFVHIMSLGDYSVTWRIAGFLKETRKLITTKARLRKMMLDCLHNNGIEIASPTIMNQRVFPETTTFTPKIKYRSNSSENNDVEIEELIFDKADQAETIENLKDQINELDKKIEALKGDERSETIKVLENLKGLRDRLHKRLKEQLEKKN